MSILLIHPPISKPSEPPPGLAKLLGSLKRHSVQSYILDANVEGLLSLMGTKPASSDRWTGRAFRSLRTSLATLRRPYTNFDRYKRAVVDVNHLLEVYDGSGSIRMGLANFQHDRLSPVKSTDLLASAEHPEENPFYNYFRWRLSEVLNSACPSIVGISLNFLSQALCTFAMLGYLRKKHPTVKLVLGGGLVTSWMRRPGWRNPFGGLVDELIAGPGQEPLLSMAGATILEDEQHCAPDYGSFELDDYLSPGRILPYSASSGCYWNKCAFCPERAERNPYTAVPTSSVMQQLVNIISDMKPVLLHILDNALSPSLMNALCATPVGIPWYGFTRITPLLAEPDFCRSLRLSGCTMLKIGIESGDQGVLDSEQKGLELGLASRVLESLSDAGIATYVYLLFGTPSESLAEARRTLQFAVTHSSWIRFLNLAIFNLPIHGPEAQRLSTEMHYEGDLSLYTGFEHPRGWNRAFVRQFLDKEFKRHPAIAGILRNEPPIFTSNHAPFFAGGTNHSIS